MVFSLRDIILGLIAVIVVFIILDTARSYMLLRKGKVLTEHSVPFEQIVSNAKMQILVLGDSTAVGTGAENPQLSTAGRLGALYPEANLTNLAENGLRLEGLLTVLDSIPSDKKFSIILVQIGANDIIRFGSMKNIEEDAEKVFARLSKQTDMLVVLHSGNVGDSKFFPFYVRPLLSIRSLKMREIYQTLAQKYGAHYVDLINSSSRELLLDERHYAEDQLHLNGDGYGLWFSEIKKSLD